MAGAEGAPERRLRSSGHSRAGLGSAMIGSVSLCLPSLPAQDRFQATKLIVMQYLLATEAWLRSPNGFVAFCSQGDGGVHLRPLLHYGSRALRLLRLAPVPSESRSSQLAATVGGVLFVCKSLGQAPQRTS